jgi:hypothetical protein
VRTRTWDVVCEELIGHYAAAIEGRRVAAALPSPLP